MSPALLNKSMYSFGFQTAAFMALLSHFVIASSKPISCVSIESAYSDNFAEVNCSDEYPVMTSCGVYANDSDNTFSIHGSYMMDGYCGAFGHQIMHKAVARCCAFPEQNVSCTANRHSRYNWTNLDGSDCLVYDCSMTVDPSARGPYKMSSTCGASKYMLGCSSTYAISGAPEKHYFGSTDPANLSMDTDYVFDAQVGVHDTNDTPSMNIVFMSPNPINDMSLLH